MYFDLLTVTSQWKIMDSEIWPLTCRASMLFFFSSSLNIFCVTHLLKDTQNPIVSLTQAWWLHRCLAVSAGADLELYTKPVCSWERLWMSAQGHIGPYRYVVGLHLLFRWLWGASCAAMYWSWWPGPSEEVASLSWGMNWVAIHWTI